MANTKSASHPEKVLDFIEVVGAVMEKAAEAQTVKAAQDKQIADLIPSVVKALLDNERIHPHEKEAAEKVLANPVEVLKILAKTAAHRNVNERAELGKPATNVKKANYNSLNDNYVGRKSRPETPESYKALERGLGLS